MATLEPVLDAPPIQSFKIVRPAEDVDLDLDIPIAMRRPTRKRRVPARFGKSSDLLPSAQMAALSTYSQAITPESSPTPSEASSPPVS